VLLLAPRSHRRNGCPINYLLVQFLIDLEDYLGNIRTICVFSDTANVASLSLLMSYFLYVFRFL